MPAAIRVSLSRPARREHLAELVTFAVDAARAVGADDGVRHAVRLAVEEVCLNVMVHGYAGDGAGPLQVEVGRDGDDLVLRIADEARAFDPATLPPPRLDAAAEERRPGGLGWHLVRELMDEVRHEARRPSGNLVTLRKRLGTSATSS
jgi:serine/threonine-protein kinase RsbW